MVNLCFTDSNVLDVGIDSCRFLGTIFYKKARGDPEKSFNHRFRSLRSHLCQCSHNGSDWDREEHKDDT